MNADAEQSLNDLTEKVIGCAFRIGNKLGCGFLEKVYLNAFAVELQKVGLRFQQQPPVAVRYEGVVVGDYVPDFVVEQLAIVELKAVQSLDEIRKAQCINYLKATGLPVCLLINFGRTRVEVKRFMGPSDQTAGSDAF